MSQSQCKCIRFMYRILQYSEVNGEAKVKVKCTLVQALRLCTGRTAHRGSRGIALLFLDHGTRRWWGVSFTPRPLFTPGKDPVPIVQEVGCAPGSVWTVAENLASTGIRSLDRPSRSQSLYRLSYRAHFHKNDEAKFKAILRRQLNIHTPFTMLLCIKIKYNAVL